MNAYSTFARHYDALTENVQYARRARYTVGLFQRYCKGECCLVLDLACGTFSLGAEMTKLGMDVIGVDASPDMLAVAAQKADGALLLCQKMERLELYGTVDAAVCALDSINHLPTEAAVRKTFARLALFVRPDGVLVFDVNTRYKHLSVLDGSVFVFEPPGLFCVWRNRATGHDADVEITLDFFGQEENGDYARATERFTERIYDDAFLRSALAENGFEVVGCFAEDSEQPPDETTERVVYVAVRR